MFWCCNFFTKMSRQPPNPHDMITSEPIVFPQLKKYLNGKCFCKRESGQITIANRLKCIKGLNNLGNYIASTYERLNCEMLKVDLCCFT